MSKKNVTKKRNKKYNANRERLLINERMVLNTSLITSPTGFVDIEMPRKLYLGGKSAINAATDEEIKNSFFTQKAKWSVIGLVLTEAENGFHYREFRHEHTSRVAITDNMLTQLVAMKLKTLLSKENPKHIFNIIKIYIPTNEVDLDEALESNFKRLESANQLDKTHCETMIKLNVSTRFPDIKDALMASGKWECVGEVVKAIQHL